MKFLKITQTVFIIFIFSFFASKNGICSKVYASTYGYNSTNATDAFQEAINSGFDTVVIDLQTNNWNIESSHFFDLANKVIIFQQGVVLKAIAGVYADSDCLFKLTRCNNITLIGYRATFKMNKPEYVLLNDSEYRHCLALVNCVNIKVFGFTLRDSGGDGIYISGENNLGDGISYCENITIKNVKCINNYRQGMSICSVQNMLVSNCLFTQTNGTLPEAGVDIEPYDTYQRIVNLNFKKCSFTNNAWAGIAVALSYLDSTSLPVSIKFIDCNLKNNRLPSNEYAASEIHIGANDFSPVQGSVLFERCTVQDSQWTVLYSRKTSDAFHVTFKDCVFKNISQQQVLYNNPIFFEVPTYDIPCPALGGYTFDNVLIKYNTNFDFFRVYGWETLEGLADIDGNFIVVEPFGNGVSYENVQDTTNVTFTYTTQTGLPQTSVNINIENMQAVECDGQYATFVASRASDDISYPLAVNYDTVGSAFFSDDVELMTTSLIIPSNLLYYTDSVFARNDLIDESAENITITLVPSLLYISDSINSINIDVLDCSITRLSEDKKTENISIYPNPTKGVFTIKSNNTFENSTVKIYNITGQLLYKNDGISGSFFNVDLCLVEDGIYFIEIIEGGIAVRSSIIKD
jgi:Secretion system C-terminal sorting domain/Right handed beta helix region